MKSSSCFSGMELTGVVLKISSIAYRVSCALSDVILPLWRVRIKAA